MGKYGLSRIEPSHLGFNPLTVSLTNYTALGFHRVLKWVKALMRGLNPVLVQGLTINFSRYAFV